MENSKATFSVENLESVNQSTSFLEEQSDYFHFTNSSTSTKQDTYTVAPKYSSKEYKKLTWGRNSYEGNNLADNLHGTGFYFAQQNGQKYFYDGLFYVNKLEGYSQIFYENGTHFQGLFKEHQRFGPGVLTYPNGEQDVGFWNGFKISRLSCPVSNNFVPMLSNTQAGKTKLLCTRYLVPICEEEDTNFIKSTLTEMGASEEIINSSDEVFNIYVRNPRSMFFHKQYYNEEFYAGQPSCFIKVLADEEEPDNLWKPDDKEYKTKTERIKKLKAKIEEINDTLQTFVVVKSNLLSAVSKCQACCDWSSYVPEEQEVSEDFCELYSSISAPAKSNIQPMTSFNPFHDSLGTLTNFNDSSQPTETSFIASKSISTNIMDYICPCDEHELSDGLQHLEEQLQNISNEELFYRNIHDELSKKLSNLVRTLESPNEDVKVKLVEVKELWAWNNDDSLISMQKHCFKHRQSEDMVNFDVSNVILGSRNLFGGAGIQEKICKKFLQACNKGRKDFIRDCLRNNQVDPNLADSRGNTGVFFATVSNQQDVISLLTNSGANISQLNDEQLSPLCLSLLRYISLRNNCIDWEKAFLDVEKTCQIPTLPEWYRVNSVQSLTSTLTTCSSCNSQIRCSNIRILNLLRRMSNMDNIRSNVTKPARTSPYIFNLSCQPGKRLEVSTEPYNDTKREMEATHLTIATLLEYGANPNCGDVPYPPLILSLFTENPELVKEVIKANVDLSPVIEDNLSCLHVAASLFPSFENSSIFRVLVRYGCNANMLTGPTHWADRRKSFTGTIPDNFEIVDEGKNVLHLLCMRTDFHDDQSNFFCSIAKPLVMDTNLDATKTYLGHTPLSLAVISGNIKLLQCLLKSQAFDPYQTLDYGMGNILTLYALKRFEKVAPLADCKSVLTALIEMDLNPLNTIGGYENAVIFAEEGDVFFDSHAQKDVKTKTKAPKENKKSQTFAMKQFLKDLTRQIIIKHVQVQVTRILYEFIEEGILYDYEILATLSYQYLTPELAAAHLRTLFEYQVLEKDRLDEANLKSLLEYTDAHKKLPKKGAKTKTNKPKPDSKGKGKTKRTVEEEKIPVTLDIKSSDFQSSVNFKFTRHKYLEAAGLEMDKTRYRTCFHCLRSRNKELKLCPVCQMIYFCSAQCNNANIKLKTQHGCNVSFYDFPDSKVAELTRGLCLNDIVQTTRKTRSKRLKEIREKLLEEEGRKLRELWQSDVYGTKFLQIRPLLDKLVAKKYKNLNWNVALLKEMLDRRFQQSPGDKSMYNLDNILLKLNGRQLCQLLLNKDKDEGTVKTKQSWSTRRSSLGENTLRSIILQASFDRRDDEKSLGVPCNCTEKVHTLKSRPKLKSAIRTKKENAKIKQQYVTHKYSLNNLALAKSESQNKDEKVKKLRKIPSRYQKFVEILATYFPDDDFSLWLLPYACCSEGQLYYKFCYNEDLFKESYSLT